MFNLRKKWKIHKTEDFYQKFMYGELEDKDDYMVWAGLYAESLSYKHKFSKSQIHVIAKQFYR